MFQIISAKFLNFTKLLILHRNIRKAKMYLKEHRGQTFAHARVIVRAELSARAKTEEKYISGRLHKALEKRVNKIMRG